MQERVIPERPGIATPQGISLGDVYHTLFRRKWLIISFAVTGLLAAVALMVFDKPLYSSEAKLLVRYVRENRTLDAGGAGGEGRIRSPDEYGRGIMNAELQILTSRDLAVQVASNIGPAKIIGKGRDTNNVNLAAVLIARGLTVEAPLQSSVIRVVMQHTEPSVTLAALQALIDSYLRKHIQVHRGVGVLDDFLQTKKDEYRSTLEQTEEELVKTRTQAGVISAEDTRKTYSDELMKLSIDLFSAQTELEQRLATQRESEKPAPTNVQNAVTNVWVDPATIEQYKGVSRRLLAVQGEQRELLVNLTELHPAVQHRARQIADLQKRKKEMEQAEPALATMRLQLTTNATSTLDAATDPQRLAELRAKITVLTNQLAKVREAAAALNKADVTIRQLQRTKDLAETNYRYFSAAYEQVRVDETLSPGKIANISIVQAPTVPAPAVGKAMKTAGGVLGGCLALGLALAFLMELVFDQSVKRPTDVESRLQLPLFLSMPYFAKNGHSGSSRLKEVPAEAGAPTAEPAAGASLTTWAPEERLRAYYEALRDRLVMYFQHRNLLHKPKLVGITSCGSGAGVTTIASGLAAALSETGDGNVLLVDMNPASGAQIHPFYHGKPGCGLMDALEEQKRTLALVQENLYVVTADGMSGKRVGVLPKKFASLVPKFKAADYDYIIFDLPPVSQTSVTPKLAGLLDMVFLVFESEKTQREVASRATRYLSESRANVTVILNKRRLRIPSWLQQEI